MAIIPASRGVVFYDPTHRLYQTSYQANANLTDFTYTMQDIIDTVNASETLGAETQVALSALSSGTATPQMISETVKPGEVILIMRIANIGSSYGNLIPTTATDGGLVIQFPPLIINKSDYTNAQLFGSVNDAYENFSSPNQVFNLGATGSNWMLKGLWEVSTYIQYAAFADNLHDGTNPVPMYVMTTVGGGNDDIDFLEVGTDKYSNFGEVYQEEFIIDSHKFTSDYQSRTVTKSDGSTISVDSDFYTHEVKSKFIINNWTHHYFGIFVYPEGGTGAGAFGSPCVFGGVKAITEWGQANGKNFNFSSTTGSTIDTDVVRINGVKLSHRATSDTIGSSLLGSFGTNIGGQFDFMRGSGADAGYVVIKWLGATQPESYYYYGGDGIGTGNLD